MMVWVGKRNDSNNSGVVTRGNLMTFPAGSDWLWFLVGCGEIFSFSSLLLVFFLVFLV